MLKLYGGARSRASIVQWYLEELSVPYEYISLNLQAGEHRQPEFLAINPIGKVPAIVDGDFKLWESGAILLYLADKYDAAVTTIEQRAEIAQWILFANATFGPGVFIEANREREMSRYLTFLDQYLDSRSFLIGDQLSAADIAVGSFLAYMPIMLKLGFEDYAAVDRYVKQLVARPGFQKSIGAR
ncbi:glutathione S-transferase family protein [Thermocoleostomius sinensis]|uniref:Glutathione S-transferase n=1 Tax=Thermocoleostomius sinensis A174 TaxID=2016057 RepID=A0A9E8ZBA1_9CYAN|nr:glutathione S-transferase [Thermocoleostomius sinensis]WAL58799.1 glutathione S-transferase [Thermocoleostomius sinensis A174]